MRFIKYLLLLTISVYSLTAGAVEHLKMSTTTSTENSGLLAILNPAFEQAYDAKVDVIAVGTGKAMKIGSRGDVDIVFVHAPAAEMKYVEQGDFIDRKAVMHNDFLFVGPASDPAQLSQAKTATDALKQIAEQQEKFVSRGDDSGTHKKELALWQQAGVFPDGEWYIEAGQGMGAILTMANQLQAYTLTDRGTFIALSEKLALVKNFDGDEALYNPYHIMAVNPEKHPHTQYELAQKYIEFVTGAAGQKIIAEYRKNGQQLFYPDAIVQP